MPNPTCLNSHSIRRRIYDFWERLDERREYTSPAADLDQSLSNISAIFTILHAVIVEGFQILVEERDLYEFDR
jgi:hypothetical protein